MTPSVIRHAVTPKHVWTEYVLLFRVLRLCAILRTLVVSRLVIPSFSALATTQLLRACAMMAMHVQPKFVSMGLGVPAFRLVVFAMIQTHVLLTAAMRYRVVSTWKHHLSVTMATSAQWIRVPQAVVHTRRLGHCVMTPVSAL
jgi:presenilin-like A22 family membrane protease